MSRRRRNQIGEQFAPRTISMLESPAYRELSLSAHRVLARVEIEFAHHAGTDNGRLPVTYDNFEHYGVHRHAIAPAIRECVALGFLEITEPGRAGNADFRRPTQYRLTYRHTDRASPTDEWRRIGDALQAAALAGAARKNRNPVPVSAKSRCGNHHRKPKIHSAESATTSFGADSTTTFDISGRGAA